MRSDSFQLSASDGVSIFVYRWLPDAAGPPRAVLQIAHGMGEHAARYERLARRLTAEGYAVLANDHRGHGRTAAGPCGWIKAAELADLIADVEGEAGWHGLDARPTDTS